MPPRRPRLPHNAVFGLEGIRLHVPAQQRPQCPFWGVRGTDRIFDYYGDGRRVGDPRDSDLRHLEKTGKVPTIVSPDATNVKGVPEEAILNTSLVKVDAPLEIGLVRHGRGGPEGVAWPPDSRWPVASRSRSGRRRTALARNVSTSPLNTSPFRDIAGAPNLGCRTSPNQRT